MGLDNDDADDDNDDDDNMPMRACRFAKKIPPRNREARMCRRDTRKWVVRFAQSVSQLVKSNPLGTGHRGAPCERCASVPAEASAARST